MQEWGHGGKGRIHPDAIDGQTLSAERGDGAPPKTDDVDYDDVAGTTETRGLVVIHFVCTIPPVR